MPQTEVSRTSTSGLTLIRDAALWLRDAAGLSVSASLTRRDIDHLPSTPFLRHLLQPDREAVLRHLRSRNSPEQRRKDARACLATLNLVRELNEIKDHSTSLWSHRALFIALRKKFIADPSTLRELRNSLAVAHFRTRDLHQLLQNSTIPALADQGYLVFCLCRLIDTLDTCARDAALGPYFFLRPPPEERLQVDIFEVAELPERRPPQPLRAAQRRLQIADGIAQPREASEVPLLFAPPAFAGVPTKSAPCVEGEPRKAKNTDGSSLEAGAALLTSQVKKSSIATSEEKNVAAPSERTAKFVLAAAAFGFALSTAAMAFISIAALPWGAAAFAASASPFLALFAAARVGRAVWRSRIGAISRAPVGKLATEKTAASIWQRLGRNAFAPSSSRLSATTVGALGGAASGAGAAWLGLFSTSALAIAAPLSTCAGAALGLAWARRTPAPLGGAPAA